jgi:hypothetical protein
MSEHLKSARKSMKDKLARYLDKSEGPVDASGYEIPGFLRVGVKTGARPVSRTQYKRGGKVTAEAEGEKVKHNAGRKPRKSGSAELTANSYINRDQREANDEREGYKHIGAYKRGGRAEKAGGGLMDPGLYGMRNEPATSRMSKAAGLKRGGRAKKAYGGDMDGNYGAGMEMAAGDKKRKAPPPPPPSPPPPPPKKKKKTIHIYPNEPYEPMPEGYEQETTPYGFKRGGKTKKFEGSARDEREDKILQKKHRMSHKEWEASELDEKHDRQRSMKGLRSSGGRLPRKSGGRTEKSLGGDLLTAGMVGLGGLGLKRLIGGGKSGDAKPAGDDDGAMRRGGRLARKSGGRAKGKTNINIVIATGKSPQDQMGGLGPQPGMPPAPPLGRPVPMPPPGGAPAAGAPMPMPMPMPIPMPAGGPPAGSPPMGRKYGGRSNHKESRAPYKK